MGSRRFFFFLPGSGSGLRFDCAVRELLRGGMELSSRVFINSIDENGLLLASREERLEEPVSEALGRVLAEGRLVEVACSDGRMSMCCSLGSQHSTPVFSVNVPRKSWLLLDDDVREQYEQLLVRVANGAGAVNILTVDDPSDDFLGRIASVDGRWMVDTYRLSGVEMEPLTVLVNSDRVVFPVMRQLRFTGRRIDNFQEYEEVLDGEIAS